jgi:hypothetical protein
MPAAVIFVGPASCCDGDHGAARSKGYRGLDEIDYAILERYGHIGNLGQTRAAITLTARS